MGRKYNTPYKKGKFLKGTLKSVRADRSKTAKNLTTNYAVWKSDSRKYDYPHIDTGNDFAKFNDGKKVKFKYKFRSKKKLGKKKGRENKHYRRYWY